MNTTLRSTFESTWLAQGESRDSLLRPSGQDNYTDPATQKAWETWQLASAAVLERCAKELELSPPALRLLAGEMTAQEMRTVRAVLTNRATVLRSLA